MTMTITLELTPELEARLQEGIAHRDTETVRQVLTEAIEPTVEALLTERRPQLSFEEAEKLLDQLCGGCQITVATRLEGSV